MGTARVTLSVALFGTPRFSAGEMPLELAVPRAALSLLAYLLVFRGEPLKRDRVAFAIWPDEIDSDARANLRRHLYLLTRALPQTERPWILTDGRTIAWNARADASIDIDVFERAADDAEQRQASLDAYTGDLLETYVDEWIDEPRRRYRDLFSERAVEAAESALRRGEGARAAAIAHRLLVLDPWREDAIRLLMRARVTNADRAGALATYQGFERALKAELEAEPAAETQRLAREIADVTIEVRASASSLQRTPLPAALSIFIGRDRELASLTHALERVRIVTITGPGGVGKSRLAVHAARTLRATFDEEPIFVQLTPAIDDVKVVENCVLGAFGIAASNEPAADVVARIAGSKRLLLVVDNADHVVAATNRVVSDILARTPGVRFLTTSQQPLHLEGEQVIVIPPLSVAPTSATFAEIMSSEAVQFFMDRARLLEASFDVAPREVGHLGSICHRLDGLPLSIELAAARTNVLTLSEIDVRLSDRFGLLQAKKTDGAGHRRTLRTTLNWSFDLLDDREATLFRRLGVFTSGWTLEAAAAVADLEASGSDDVLESLSGLIEKSLCVSVAGAIPRRFGYLESVRAYAQEKLVSAGEVAAAERALRVYYSGFVSERHRQFSTRLEKAAFDEIALEHANILAALDTAIAAREIERATVMACDLTPFWVLRGLTTEARQRLDALLFADDLLAVGLRSRLRSVISLVNFRQGRIPEATSAANEALEFAEAAASDTLVAEALSAIARCSFTAQDYDSAAAVLERSHHLFEAAGDRVGVARTLNFMAMVADARGDAVRASNYFRDSLDIYEAAGNLYGIATVNYHLGFRAYAGRDYETAIGYSEKAIEVWHEYGDVQGENWAQYNLACAEARLGFIENAALRQLACLRTAHLRGFVRDVADCLDRLAAIVELVAPELSAKCLGHAARLRERNGHEGIATERDDYDACVRAVREALPAWAFEGAWRDGAARDADSLIAELAGVIPSRLV